MTAKSNSPRTPSSPTAEMRVKRRRARVKVGDVTVLVHKPTAAEVQQNVDKGTEALKRLRAKLIRPGVRVYARKDVPLYSADPDQPGVYIRKLNGQTDRGVLEGGRFRVLG